MRAPYAHALSHVSALPYQRFGNAGATGGPTHLLPFTHRRPLKPHLADNAQPSPTTLHPQVDPTAALRTLDMGPAADRAKEAAAFRKFWGDKAELRRFQVCPPAAPCCTRPLHQAAAPRCRLRIGLVVHLWCWQWHSPPAEQQLVLG